MNNQFPQQFDLESIRDQSFNGGQFSAVNSAQHYDGQLTNSQSQYSRFSTQLVEKLDGCSPSTCGPSGTCIPVADGNPLSKICLCNQVQSYGLDCKSELFVNSFMNNFQSLEFFESPTNPVVFVHCEGLVPHIKLCGYPLKYNPTLERYDW